MTKQNIRYKLVGIELWGNAPSKKEIIDLLDNKQSYFSVQEIERFKTNLSAKLRARYGSRFSQIMMPRYKETQETCLTIDFINTNANIIAKIYPIPNKQIKINKQIINLYEIYTREIRKCLADSRRNCGKSIQDSSYFSSDKKLQQIEKQLTKIANDNFEILLKASREDRSDKKRAATTFILGWHSNKKKLIPTLQYNFYDPHFEVQNNAALMLIPILMFNKYSIPINPIIDLLQMPSGTSRNKALALIYHILVNRKQQINFPNVAWQIIKKSARSKQLNHSSFAIPILSSTKQKKSAA